MKYVLSCLGGTLTGALLFLMVLYYNPLANTLPVSPLAVYGQPLIDLEYSTVPSEMIAYTNNGKSRIQPYPKKVAELWEPTVRKTIVLVTLLTDSGGRPKGLGVKFASESERTSLLKAEALVDSAWHVFLPESGSLFIDQTENMWSYARNIIVPARWSSADSWRGTWYGITTAGPTALGTAKVAGGTGRFATLSSEAVEAINARAYSAQQGPVSATGSLTIAAVEPVADH